MSEQREVRRVWLQITSGRGPAECQLAVAGLAPVLVAEAIAAGLAAEVIDAVPGSERGTLLSALVKVSGAGAAGFARAWTGSIKWIAPSPFRPTHKRKNWFIGVELIGAPPERGQAPLDARDVDFATMRAGGAGGQHVNKTESAVRATHRPTGLVAEAREERSQHMNRRLALARLARMLAEGHAAKEAAAEQQRWAEHDRLERGNPVRTFHGPELRERR